MRKVRAREGKLLPQGQTATVELGFRTKPVSEVLVTPFSLLTSVPKPTVTGAVCWDPAHPDPRHVPWGSLPMVLTRPGVAMGKTGNSLGPEPPSSDLCFALQGDTWLPQLERVESGFEPSS